MINFIKDKLNRRKVKVFTVLLLCSSAAWFLTKLSESYTSNAVFDLSYVNAPDTLLLVNKPKDKIDVKLKATGFQFLSFSFKNKKIKLDLNKVKKRGLTYFVPAPEYKKQIEGQLPNTMELRSIDSDTLFFKFKKLYQKKIPIKSRLGISLPQNYILEGKLIVKPDSVVITGLKEEIDTVKSIATEKLSYTDVTADFSCELALSKPSKLITSKLSLQKVKISGKVVRFSEKVIDVPVSVINLPKDTQLRTFPNVISILCKAKIEALKKLEPIDFNVVVDYEAIKNNEDKVLKIKLLKSPPELHSAKLLEQEVEYIVKRQ